MSLYNCSWCDFVRQQWMWLAKENSQNMQCALQHHKNTLMMKYIEKITVVNLLLASSLWGNFVPREVLWYIKTCVDWRPKCDQKSWVSNLVSSPNLDITWLHKVSNELGFVDYVHKVMYFLVESKIYVSNSITKMMSECLWSKFKLVFPSLFKKSVGSV